MVAWKYSFLDGVLGGQFHFFQNYELQIHPTHQNLHLKRANMAKKISFLNSQISVDGTYSSEDIYCSELFHRTPLLKSTWQEVKQ